MILLYFNVYRGFYMVCTAPYSLLVVNVQLRDGLFLCLVMT